jgi:hypothetical protein
MDMCTTCYSPYGHHPRCPIPRMQQRMQQQQQTHSEKRMVPFGFTGTMVPQIELVK